ncbi:Rha family transcriptional regulator [Jeotgalibaca arthritidis]|uniref:Rha family transcriptional regulator n=1 Tax=Jeotgalibaca arthritidis TaxID=1868794 RepID=UPI00359F88B6
MELVVMQNQQAVTSSLQVAGVFEKQHKDVLEAIDNKIQSAENSAHYKLMFAPGEYKDSRGRTQRMYYMNRDGFSFIAFGFTGRKADDFKLKYIKAFNEMENHIKDSRATLPTEPMEVLKLMFQATEEIQADVQGVKGRVIELEENQSIKPGDYGYISRRIHQRIAEVAKGYGKITQKQRGELYRDINGGIKKITGVGSRTQLRDKHYQTVVDFINDWEPSTATKTIVRQSNFFEDEAPIF